MALALTGAVAGSSARAEACSIIFIPELRGSPRQGDLEIPTDAVLAYDADALGIDGEAEASTATLTSETGESVELAVRRVDSAWEFAPRAPLQPHMTYEFRVMAGTSRVGETGELSLTFLTREGPIAVPPPAPIASYERYRVSATLRSSCSMAEEGVCVSLVQSLYSGILYQVTSIDLASGAESPSRLVDGSFFALSELDAQRCVRIRTRAANGTLSDPVTLCGDDNAPLRTFDRDVRLECTHLGVAEKDPPSGTGGAGGVGAGGGATGARAGAGGEAGLASGDRYAKGCTCSLPRAGHDDALVAAASILGVLALRRRRRGRPAQLAARR